MISEDDRRRNVAPPSRYEKKSYSAPTHIFSAGDKVKQEYFMYLDLLMCEINRRFDQAGLRQLITFETLLLDASKSVKVNMDQI